MPRPLVQPVPNVLCFRQMGRPPKLHRDILEPVASAGPLEPGENVVIGQKQRPEGPGLPVQIKTHCLPGHGEAFDHDPL